MIVHIGNTVPAERFYRPREAVVSVAPVGARKQIERGLPAEQGKGVSAVETRESSCGPAEGLAWD